MTKKRQLETTSPGKKPRRTAKFLTHAEYAMSVRDVVAKNLKGLVDSACQGSVPEMARQTGLSVNVLRRTLKGRNGTSIDTLAAIADTYGIQVTALFDGLTEQNEHMVKMLTDMQRDIAQLKAKTGP